MKAITLGLAGAALSLTIVAANALTIDPRCTKMRNKVGCTCALQNGGYIKPDGGYGTARGSNAGRPTNQAYTDCLVRHGRS